MVTNAVSFRNWKAQVGAVKLDLKQVSSYFQNAIRCKV